jgi:hypothetical protein
MSNLNNINSEEEQQQEQVRIIKVDNEELSVGDYLKSKFVTSKAMPICVVSGIYGHVQKTMPQLNINQDLFFAFPWNNFLHYVIYDMLHQVFNGRMDVGLNRQLAISILKEGQLTDKIVIAQKANDEEW